MTEAPVQAVAEPMPSAPPRSQWADVWDQFRTHRGALWGMAVFALILILVLVGPFVYWNDPKFVPTGRDFLTLRDTRSRWGSCSTDGNLMFSWRLILAPRQVLDYVAAHEVAHLVHMDHSSRFWGVVADLCPDYAAPRGWLRREGHGLHRFRF